MFLFIFNFQFVLQMCLFIVMKIFVLRNLCTKQSVNGLFANIKVKNPMVIKLFYVEFYSVYYFMHLLLLSA